MWTKLKNGMKNEEFGVKNHASLKILMHCLNMDEMCIWQIYQVTLLQWIPLKKTTNMETDLL